VNIGSANEDFYDVGMIDSPHTFFANDILVHNSVYLSSVPLAKLEDVYPADMAEYTIKVAGEIAGAVNDHYKKIIPELFYIKPEKNRIVIIPDVITSKTLWAAKKRYAMLKVYDMEKKEYVKDKKTGKIGKLEVKGIDTVRSSFPAAFRKFASDMLESILREGDRIALDKRILEFEAGLEKISILDASKNTSVKFISQKGDKEYNPRGRKPMQFELGTPVGVKAALAYNDFLKLKELDKRTEPILHGQKVRWIYLQQSEYGVEAMAFKADDTDPQEILDFIEQYADKEQMYNHELKGKLEEFHSILGWEFPNEASKRSEGFFDMSETF